MRRVKLCGAVCSVGQILGMLVARSAKALASVQRCLGLGPNAYSFLGIWSHTLVSLCLRTGAFLTQCEFCFVQEDCLQHLSFGAWVLLGPVTTHCFGTVFPAV